MRASRLLSILIVLQLRGHATAQSLAERFEVSRRTILRDMDELSAAGIPVYAERGTNGGFRLLDGFRTNLTGLDRAERDAMFLSGLPKAAADLGLRDPAASARLKLAAATGNSEPGLAERFYFDSDAWYQLGRPVPHLHAIAEAVWRETELRIDYESWRTRAWRTVAPLGVVLKAGEWYLVAGTSKGPSIFRVASVHAVEPQKARVARPPGFDLAECWTGLLRRFDADRLRLEARIRLRPSAFERIDRLGSAAAELIRNAEPDENGFVTAVIPIESVGHGAGLMLEFADEIEVLEPQELRAKIASCAARIVALYV